MYTKPGTPADSPLLLCKTASQWSSNTAHDEKVQLKAVSKISKWGAGRRTPVIMLSSYILGIYFYLSQSSSSKILASYSLGKLCWWNRIAFLIATAHLGLFLYLDGKPLNGSTTSIPAQSYVSATSNILANLFGIALTTSVGIVFTQYLWYLLRQSAWRLSSIESMFSMQTNPLMLQHPDMLKNAPLLGLLASIMWSINIAANFAPGALTVGPTIQYTNEITEIPTFNSSFVCLYGYLSLIYRLHLIGRKWLWLRCKSLFFRSLPSLGRNIFTWVNSTPYNTRISNWHLESSSQYGTYSSTLARLTIQTMITGAPSSMSSPCGPNCSYTLAFTTPYL